MINLATKQLCAAMSINGFTYFVGMKWLNIHDWVKKATPFSNMSRMIWMLFVKTSAWNLMAYDFSGKFFSQLWHANIFYMLRVTTPFLYDSSSIFTSDLTLLWTAFNISNCDASISVEV